jgi:hypothetical protein
VEIRDYKRAGIIGHFGVVYLKWEEGLLSTKYSTPHSIPRAGYSPFPIYLKQKRTGFLLTLVYVHGVWTCQQLVRNKDDPKRILVRTYQ